jgi:hypothetical protein
MIMGCLLFYAGLASFLGGTPFPRIRSVLGGQRLHLPASLWVTTQGSRRSIHVTMMSKSLTQFIQGMNEQSVPDVKVTKSRDDTIGMTTFSFDHSSRELGDIYKYSLCSQ